MTTASDVKEYYDDFAKSVLLQDFYRLNLRQEAIKDLCGEYVARGARVLEIGCGVGIIARYLGKRGCTVLGVDISDRNIALARAYAESERVGFKVLDILEQADEIAGAGRFDAILLPDVIEHIPKSRYADLFRTIERVLGEGGRVLLTFPSPEYQEYLKANRPEALQVVDETVTLDDIVDNTSLELLLFRYRDVWQRHQYVHVVLTADRAYSPVPIRRGVIQALRYRLRKYRWRLSNLLFLQKVRRKSQGR